MCAYTDMEQTNIAKDGTPEEIPWTTMSTVRRMNHLKLDYVNSTPPVEPGKPRIYN